MRTMDAIELILGRQGQDQNNYKYPVRAKLCDSWEAKVFYRMGAGPRKCLIGCNGTLIWIWVGSPPVDVVIVDLADPNSIKIIKDTMGVTADGTRRQKRSME